jgi:NAD-dependent deacetylase
MASTNVPWRTLATLLRHSQNTVIITGAGISTESGIPDFRSPGGVWARYQPVRFPDFLTSAAARVDYWRQKSEGHEQIMRARPNTGHAMLAAWEQRGLIRGVITQNIDGLHQLAGNANVLELHGTAREVACLGCRFRAAADPYVTEFTRTQNVPTCPRCGGLLKHATISFGQQLPLDVLSAADRWCRQAELVFVLGSSLTVSPAADLPRIAVGCGARLIIINRTETPLDKIATVVLRENLGESLQLIDHAFMGNS